MTNVSIPDGVTAIGSEVFMYCSSLASIRIPDGLASIGSLAFYGCSSLTSITFPVSLTNIEGWAFNYCSSLTSAYFKGNAPSLETSVFQGAENMTVYYLPGTSGWGTTVGGRPTVFWRLTYPIILNLPPSFGLLTNGFGFTISWATNASVVVEARNSVANAKWLPIATNIINDTQALSADPQECWSYFSDPEWTNYPARFYRLRSP